MYRSRAEQMAPQQPAITLTDLECRIATNAGRVIHNQHKNNGTPDKKITPKDGLKILIDGIAAEMAIARLLNIYPLTMTGEVKIHDLIKDGMTIDVKNAYGRNHGLLVPKHKFDEGKTCDIYILTIGEMPHFEFKGFAFSQQVFTKENITDLGYGPTYLLDQWKLSKHLP